MTKCDENENVVLRRPSAIIFGDTEHNHERESKPCQQPRTCTPPVMTVEAVQKKNIGHSAATRHLHYHDNGVFGDESFPAAEVFGIRKTRSQWSNAELLP